MVIIKDNTLIGGLLFLCLLQSCSTSLFPVDTPLEKAILMDLEGRDCFQDPTAIQDSLIFIGIVFNNHGEKDSIKIFHQAAPPFFILPEASSCYVGTWKGDGHYITVVNDLPEETEYMKHLDLNAFDTSYERYFELCAYFSETLDVSYDGMYYRTIGKYENGHLRISKSGWFYGP